MCTLSNQNGHLFWKRKINIPAWSDVYAISQQIHIQSSLWATPAALSEDRTVREVTSSATVGNIEYWVWIYLGFGLEQYDYFLISFLDIKKNTRRFTKKVDNGNAKRLIWLLLIYCSHDIFLFCLRSLVTLVVLDIITFHSL